LARRKRLVFPERRSDEQSLYYILERDLDREAIIPRHDGWYPQYDLGDGKKIDYVVGYGGEVYGIEVKTGYPKLRHFKQIDGYRGVLSGVFLAYPSDRVAEALFISQDRSRYPGVGLVSMTAYRSHIIRPAQRTQGAKPVSKRWKELFDLSGYLRVIKESPHQKIDSLPATVLKDGCIWVSVDARGNALDEEDKKIGHKLPLTAWRGLALLYASGLTVGYAKYFSRDLLDERCTAMGWNRYDPWVLSSYGLALSREYGETLYMWRLSESAWFLRRSLKDRLERELGHTEWRRLLDKVKEWRKDHKREQVRERRVFSTG